jgi:hypothetical protein
MKITSASHTDHALPSALVAFIAAKYESSEGFLIDTFELPAEFAAVPCGLIGPATGGQPVLESSVTYVTRGNRPGPSRMVDAPPAMTRKVTVVMGEHGGSTVLFTAYGGPCAPREPWDTSLSDEERLDSKIFWAQHALSSQV